MFRFNVLRLAPFAYAQTAVQIITRAVLAAAPENDIFLKDSNSANILDTNNQKLEVGTAAINPLDIFIKDASGVNILDTNNLPLESI